MTFTKIIAATALISAALATPVLAQDIAYGADGRTGAHSKYLGGGNGYGYRGGYYNRGYGPGEVAAGIVGGAIGTAAAVAAAPAYGYGYENSYAYEPAPVYEQAPTYGGNGFVCQPGTYYRNTNGHTQLCQ